MLALDLVRKLGQALAVALVVVVVTFALVRAAPGDPVLNILGINATPESIDALRASLHLDQSLPHQFLTYFGGLVRGDLGTSLLGQRPSVASLIAEALPVTLSIVVCTIAMSILIGIPFGVVAALTRHPAIDLSIRAGATLLLATPAFYTALLLILFLAVRAGIAPAGGWAGSWPENLRYLWLPSLALSLYLAPLLARSVRQTARETMRQPFVEAAIARGLPPSRIVLRHVLPNSLLPVITILGYNVGSLLGGAVIVESVFGMPGLGLELVHAVAQRDFPVVQGIALVAGLMVVAVNLGTDVIYALIDPRTKVAG